MCIRDRHTSGRYVELLADDSPLQGSAARHSALATINLLIIIARLPQQQLLQQQQQAAISLQSSLHLGVVGLVRLVLVLVLASWRCAVRQLAVNLVVIESTV